MMLDMKRTFDEFVEANADADRAAAILENPFYLSLSSSFAGTQEYMAMEKLGQLRARAEAEQTWDLIVVDTPPSRSALDFLDAPRRLGSFLDGRFIRILAAPAKAGGRAYLRVLSAGFGMFTSVLSKVIGGQVLVDVQTFVASVDTLFGGFRQRADDTFAMLQADDTAFVVVAAPERDALREASYFVDRLEADSMPLAGLVLNRVQTTTVPDLDAATATAAAARLEAGDPRVGHGRAAADPCRPGGHPRPAAPPRRAVHRGAPRRAGRVGARPGRRRRRPRRACARWAPPSPSAPSWRSAGQALAETTSVRSMVTSYSSRAVSSSRRQEVTCGRRRSSARRSRSVIPPQTPNSIRLSRASARHSVRTGQARQMALARFWAAPCTKRASGSLERQAADVVQSDVQVIEQAPPQTCGDRSTADRDESELSESSRPPVLGPGRGGGAPTSLTLRRSRSFSQVITNHI